jgi:translation elongation factor EF-Tu-like GTPase
VVLLWFNAWNWLMSSTAIAIRDGGRTVGAGTVTAVLL